MHIETVSVLVLELSRIVAGLLAKNRILSEKNISLANRVNSLTDEIRSLKEQLALLKAKRFGKSVVRQVF